VAEAGTPLGELILCAAGTCGDGGRRTLGVGAVIGLADFLHGATHWPYTLKALTRVELWAVEIVTFRDFLQTHERLGIAWRSAATGLTGLLPSIRVNAAGR